MLLLFRYCFDLFFFCSIQAPVSIPLDEVEHIDLINIAICVIIQGFRPNIEKSPYTYHNRPLTENISNLELSYFCADLKDGIYRFCCKYYHSKIHCVVEVGYFRCCIKIFYCTGGQPMG